MSGRVDLVNSGSILGLFWTLSWTLSEKPHEIPQIAFIWPWVGLISGLVLNMGPGMVLGWVPV